MMNKGFFIVFEGIDGAGKSTQVALLRQRLEALGQSVALTAEPTEGEVGKELRRALSGKDERTECQMAAMFVLDRIEHNKSCIEPLLDLGKTVICDRYYYSNLAYQGQSTDYNWVKAANLKCPEIRRPDLCIYLDLTPEESLGRIQKRGEATEIYENIQRLTATRNAFLSLIDDLSQEGEQIVKISANSSPEAIAQEIFSKVKEILFK